MDDLFLTMKSYEYMARARLAGLRGERDREKKAAGATVVITRLMARNAVEDLKEKQAAAVAAARSWKKAKESNILFPLGEQRIEKMKQEAKKALEQLVSMGTLLSATLDIWQDCGATLRELCNLCNRDYQQVVKEIGSDQQTGSFSKLIFVHNLDYKDPSNRGWIDYDVDAPMTHAIKEYMLDLMLHTPEGKQASHEALIRCFPEIWDNRIVRYVDADGIEHFVDADGVEILAEDT